MQQLLLDGIMVVITLSVIPMGAVALVSGCIGLIQAATQIQEPSVTHLARLCVFFVVALVAGDWASSEIVSLFERSLKALEMIGRGS